MPQTFDCPSCGAALEYPGGIVEKLDCTYCGNNVAIPAEFWQEAKTAKTTKQWGRYLIIFLVVTVGVPSCVGLLGAIIGVGAALLGIIAPFIVQVFAR